jgi:hypothetical protein
MDQLAQKHNDHGALCSRSAKRASETASKSTEQNPFLDANSYLAGQKSVL